MDQLLEQLANARFKLEQRWIQGRTISLVDRLADRLVNRGLPWVVLGDFNIRAGAVKLWCDGSVHASKIAILSPWATSFSGKGQAGSDIDYVVAGVLFARVVVDYGDAEDQSGYSHTRELEA